MKKRWVAVIGTLSLVSGVLLGVFLTKKNAEIKYKELKERLAKFEDYFAIVNKWLKNRNQHISVADYFKNNHCNLIPSIIKLYDSNANILDLLYYTVDGINRIDNNSYK